MNDEPIVRAARRWTLPLVLVPMLVLAASTAVRAADPKPKPKPEAVLGGGKATGAYLTKEQLRDCLARQDKLKDDDAELVKEQAAVQAEKEALAKDGDEMKAKLESVDRTNPESVAAYNEAVDARNKKVEAFQTRATAFNTRVDANEHLHADYGPACSNRRYFEEDAAALKKAR